MCIEAECHVQMKLILNREGRIDFNEFAVSHRAWLQLPGLMLELNRDFILCSNISSTVTTRRGTSLSATSGLR